MNGNSILANDAYPTDPIGSDPMPLETAEEERALGSTETECGTDEGESDCGGEAAVDLSASSDPDSDPGLDPASEEIAEGGLEQLRAELRELKQSLGARDAFFARLGAECEEFSTLFPGTALTAIPEDVWKDVHRGIPLAAAYALTERRRAVREQIAAESNLENKQRSAGAVTGEPEDFFSPTEVRQMSQREVRSNYEAIIRSMKKWS